MTKSICAIMLLLVIVTTLLSPLFTYRDNPIYYENQVAVLMYHHIHDKDTSSSTITSKLFRDQLNYLKEKNYEFITLQEFKQYMDGASVPDNAVLITFDDGYQSFYTDAYPTLRELVVPAVNFIITADTENPLAPYIPAMSKEQITDMTHNTNFIDVQCHTHALHYKLPSGDAALVGRLDQNGALENDEQYRNRVVSDTTACRQQLLSHYNQPIDSFAYPYGITDKQASSLIAEVGFKYAFTVISGMATRESDILRIPRINAGGPTITPEMLHHTIQRRVVANDPFSERLDLHSAVTQLGGSIEEESGNQQFILHGAQITVKAKSREAVRNGQKVKLKEPITKIQDKLMISLEDLELLTQLRLIYDPASKQITERIVPTIMKNPLPEAIQ
jgi:peptidoglycan/xylan/chitin deacetylase (PgdA/CDA1 family)